MNPLKTILIIISALSMLASGCATLNESECQNADWYVIGLADGSKGRRLSHSV